MHLHVMPDSSVTPCCVSPYDDKYGDGKMESVVEIWNSEKFKNLRKKMLAGLPSSGCEHCYKLEASDFKSLRQSINERYYKNLDLILSTSADGEVPSNNLKFKYLDIRFSNLCNFKCRGCGPTLSSAWYDDYKVLNSEITLGPKVRSISIESPIFWEEIKKHIFEVEEIYFGGGEPLITKEHFEVLDILKKNKRFDVGLSYNTNLSQLHYGGVDLAEIWGHFQFVKIGISLDDIKFRAEYFRNGTNWASLEKNIKTLKKDYNKIKIYINCTVNMLNALYLPEIISYLLDEKIIDEDGFNINLLLDPEELSVQVYPEKLKKRVEEELRAFQREKLTDLKFKKMQQDLDHVIEFMNEKNHANKLNIFQEKTRRLDEIRNENFLAVYPELLDLLTN